MKASNVRIEAPDADLGDMFGADAFDEIAQGEFDLQHGHVPEGEARAGAQEGKLPFLIVISHWDCCSRDPLPKLP